MYMLHTDSVCICVYVYRECPQVISIFWVLRIPKDLHKYDYFRTYLLLSNWKQKERDEQKKPGGIDSGLNLLQQGFSMITIQYMQQSNKTVTHM